MTLSETVYSDWCEPLDHVENPTSTPCVLPELVKGVDLKLPNGREELIKAQKSDTDLVELCNKALSVEEADKVPVCYFVKDGVLMRKYRPPNIPATDEWKVYRQIVVLKKYKAEIFLRFTMIKGCNVHMLQEQNPHFHVIPGCMRAASPWRTLGIRSCRTFCSDLA